MNIYSTAVEVLNQKFVNDGFSFTDETTFQIEMLNILNELISPEEAKIINKDIKNEYNPHEPYMRGCLQKDVTPRVRAEANVIGVNGNGIDLVVLKEQMKAITNGGTKKFRQEDIEVAFEFKMVHQKDYIQDGKEDSVKQDIDELADLPEDVDKYMMIFANKGIFRDDQDKLEQLKHREEGVEVTYRHCPKIDE